MSLILKLSYVMSPVVYVLVCNYCSGTEWMLSHLTQSQLHLLYEDIHVSWILFQENCARNETQIHWNTFVDVAVRGCFSAILLLPPPGELFILREEAPISGGRRFGCLPAEAHTRSVTACRAIRLTPLHSPPFVFLSSGRQYAVSYPYSLPESSS